jgi:hypothetical protein
VGRAQECRCVDCPYDINTRIRVTSSGISCAGVGKGDADASVGDNEEQRRGEAT